MPDVTYRLDTTHCGLRLAFLMATLISAGLGIFVIMPSLAGLLDIPEAPAALIILVGGSAIGLGAGWAVERGLRIVWPSGRWLKVDEEGITLRERSGETIQVGWSKPVDVLSWYFVIRTGRGLVPKGWYCVACRLEQENAVITPYTFMQPANAAAVAQWAAFPELLPHKRTLGLRDAPQIESGGERGDLRAAEEDRWNDGAEMTPTDFAALMAEIDRRLPNWPEQLTIDD